MVEVRLNRQAGEGGYTMLRSIFIYDAPDAIGLDIRTIGHHLADLLPEVQVETRTDFFTWRLGQFDLEQVEVLAAEVGARLEEREVHDLVAPDHRREFEPEPPEERDLGVVYEAEPLQAVMRTLIPAEERGEDILHLVFITQCIGRFVAGESHFRLQIVQHGEPAIISTTGMVEAPALPREYAFRRAQLLSFGMDEAAEELDGLFAEETFRHEDPRINRVATGIALQAVFQRACGEVGCSEPTCPLRLAATHDELVQAHLSDDSRLCDRHARMLIAAREASRRAGRSEPPRGRGRH